jgi:hypothetical protein
VFWLVCVHWGSGLGIIERINNTAAARSAWEARASARLYDRNNRSPIHVLPLPNMGVYQHLVLDVEPLNPSTSYFLGFDVGTWACLSNVNCDPPTPSTP